MPRAIEIVSVDTQALVQDEGRPGYAEYGVGRAGAADLSAYRLGNRLLGNDAGAAGVEILLGGFSVRAHGSITVCLTGAPARAMLTKQSGGGAVLGYETPVHLDDGDVLNLAQPQSGLRTYLAIRGGLDVPATLGSRSTDTMSGLGPEPLAAGDRLAVGEGHGVISGADEAVHPFPASGQVQLRVSPGPRHDWFADPGALAGTWTVSPDSNRIGLRLHGTPLQRIADKQDTELPTEGMVRGAIQVTPDGQPVVFLSDHPVTGGYPVIAVVRAADVDKAAQLQPGQPVGFRYR
ncbi:MAG: allophanate hydrolase [Micrococcales bacterium]|nr:MAG: allophanate hydrolase [Micrococcales bacterium]PIE26296.1 MAG: allophanate hydrolase [Micrococcales bacterium]